MNFDGSVTIKSKIDTVWDFLTDPHLVSQCAPGVKEVEVVIPDKQFRTHVGIALGAVKVSFAMDVRNRTGLEMRSGQVNDTWHLSCL